MSTIQTVEARTVRVPLASPVAFSTRRIAARHYTLVRVTTTDGVTGYGFCHGGAQFGGLATMVVREMLRPLLIGRDPHCTEAIWQDLHQETLLNGRAGAVMRALSAVDIALWDRNARSVGLPLWRYMGSYQTETVPAYASGGYYVDGGTDEVRREVEGHVAAGFDAVKLKIGGASPSADAARVRTAREILGPDGLLLLDANNAWRDVAHALRALRPLVEFDPYLIEEPFGPEDIESHRRLADALPLTIASGEIAGGRHAHRDLLERGGITVLQPDVAVCGGITEWRRIAAMAAGASVPVMSHSFHDINAHLIASVPNGRFVEYFPDASILPFRNLLDAQIQVRDGALVLPTSPGLGFGFEAAALDRYGQDEWG
jgi:L-alanine-DL-glutamate epimerase-like enolase superfamily enzyme